MYKDELIQIHQLFTYFMQFLLDNGVSSSYFEAYRNLAITPSHIHKTKEMHKHAIFVLASGISQVLAEGDEKTTVPMGISKKMEDLAHRYGSEA
jgi:hypothetical protein